MTNLFKKIEVGIEEIILILLIFLAIFDFLEILPIELDYIKKIISWTALGYLFYKASITNILFGKKIDWIDSSVILFYFLMIIKNLIGFTKVTIDEMQLHMVESGVILKSLAKFFIFLSSNASLIELIGLYVGLIGLIMISIYLVKFKLGKRSVLGLFHEEKKVKGIKKIVRFFMIYFILLSFFIIVFNLTMEWLTIAVDSTLAVFSIFFYLFFWVKHHKKFHVYSFIYKIGNIGEEFYEKFIELFHSKKTIYLGIVGMLVLHILTDVSNFLIPHIIGIHDALYFEQLAEIGREPLLSLFIGQTAQSSIFQTGILFLIYLFNIVAILFLFFGPAYIWEYLYLNRIMRVSRWVKSLFIFALSIFILSPVFILKQIKDPLFSLLGVDIITQKVQLPEMALIALIIALLVGVLVYILSVKFPERIRFFAFGIIQIFFIYYVLLYFLDISRYYLFLLPKILMSTNVFIGLNFLLFFLITIIFYIGGSYLFIQEIWKKQKV